MVKEIEQKFKASDGQDLFSKVWQPDLPAEGYLVFAHGFNDRCELQSALFPTLASAPFNIEVHAFDQRGWGKSAVGKQRGNSGPTTQVLQDLHEFIKHVAASVNGKPLFLMGHSMGGQVTLHYMLSTDQKLVKDRPKISGYIVASPWVGLDPSAEPGWATVFFGKMAARVLPTFQLKQKLDHRYITRDPEFNLAWKNDPLCHDLIALQPAEQMLQRASDLQTLSSAAKPVPTLLSEQLPVPTLWVHGTEDRVCAYTPSKELFERLSTPPADVVPAGIEGKLFKTYEGAYHKIHAEPDGLNIQHSKDIGEWITKIVSAEKQSERARL